MRDYQRQHTIVLVGYRGMNQVLLEDIFLYRFSGSNYEAILKSQISKTYSCLSFVTDLANKKIEV